MDMELPLNLQLARAHSRRQFLKTSQSGLGAIALASLLDRDAARRAATNVEGDQGQGGWPKPVSSTTVGAFADGSQTSALRAQGQEGGLPSHVGRAPPARLVRLQA